jgi:rubredoxin
MIIDECGYRYSANGNKQQRAKKRKEFEALKTQWVQTSPCSNIPKLFQP